MARPLEYDEHGEVKMPREWRDPKVEPAFAQFIEDMLTIERAPEVMLTREYAGPAVTVQTYREAVEVRAATTVPTVATEFGYYLVVRPK
jgi:hypothetical protein